MLFNTSFMYKQDVILDRAEAGGIGKALSIRVPIVPSHKAFLVKSTARSKTSIFLK